MKRVEGLDAAILTGTALLLPSIAFWMPEPPGAVLVACTTALACLAVVLLVPRDEQREPRAVWLSVLVILPAVSAMLARGTLPRTVLWGWTPHGPFGLICLGVPGFCLVIAAAVVKVAPRLESLLARGRARSAWPLGLATLACGALLVVTRAPIAPRVALEQLEALRMGHSIPRMAGFGVEREPLARDVVLERSYSDERGCRVTLESPRVVPAGEAWTHAPGLCDEIAVARVGETWVVAPVEESQPRWARALAFREPSGRSVSLSVTELGQVGAPRSWSWSAAVVLALSALCLARAARARARRREIAAQVELAVDEDGRVVLAAGPALTSPRLAQGTWLVSLAREPGGAGYRDEPVVHVARARPGSAVTWDARLGARADALALAGLALALLAVAPLVVAEWTGFVVAVPWAP